MSSALTDGTRATRVLWRGGKQKPPRTTCAGPRALQLVQGFANLERQHRFTLWKWLVTVMRRSDLEMNIFDVSGCYRRNSYWHSQNKASVPAGLHSPTNLRNLPHSGTSR